MPRKPARVALSVLLIALVVIGYVASSRNPGVPVYAKDDASLDLVTRAGLGQFIVRDLRRDAHGQRVYATCSVGEATRLFMIGENVITEVPTQRRVNYLNEGGMIVAAYNDLREGVHFIGGEILEIPMHGFFDVDYGGELFMVSQPPATTWLGQVGQPRERFLVATNLLGRRVFVGTNQIAVVGYCELQRGSRLQDRITLACCLFERTSAGYRETCRVALGWVAEVRDFEPDRMKLLAVDNWDMLHSVYIVDGSTWQRTRIGWDKSEQLILRWARQK